MGFLVFDTMANLKNMIIIVLMLSVILSTGCSTSEPEGKVQEYNNFLGNKTNTGKQPFEDTVAVVNGENVTSKDVAEMQQLFLMQGQQVSEEEALEQVINQKVLDQKVQEENIIISDEEAESIIEQQLAPQGATLEDYKQQLASQEISYTEELESLKQEIATQKYLESQLEGQSFNVSEEETQQFYEMYKEQSAEEVPPYEELKDQIIATLQQQKQQQAINALIQELRLDANIEYN